MTDRTATLLVVEDDHADRTFLADNLTADGFELLIADTAARRLRLIEHKTPGPRDHRRRAARRVGARPDRARPRRRPRASSRVDPDQRFLVLSAARGGRARPRARVRTRRRRLPRQAVLLSGAARLRVRAAAAPRPDRAARRAPAGRRRSRWTRSPATCACAGGRPAVLEGVRAAARAGGRPHARLHEGGAAARRLGLPVASARRARWTPTPAACAGSSAPRATAIWSTSGASATGSSTRCWRWRRERRLPGAGGDVLASLRGAAAARRTGSSRTRRTRCAGR